MDESGWSKEQELQRKVIVLKGKPQATVSKVFTNTHITSVHIVNASGEQMPTYLIFRNNIPTQINLNSLPDEWAYGCSKSGFIDGNLFSIWFHELFLKHLGRKRPILLILHASSTHFQPDIVETAVKENISIIILPSKTTHFLQPIDQLISRLKNEFSNLSYKCSMVKAGVSSRPSQFTPLLSSALQKSWTKEIVKQSFSRTRTQPFLNNQMLFFSSVNFFNTNT